jgi:hypothetical protein
MNNPTLLPHPQQLTLSDGRFETAGPGYIVLDSTDALGLTFAGQQLQAALGDGWELVAGSPPPDAPSVQLIHRPGATRRPEEYSLTITPEHVMVVAGTAAGVFYGVQTLRQLLSQYDDALPALRCTDWPDFTNRGVMLDISRDKVPTMETLYALVDKFAAWKINQLQLYTEHTFAYRRHPLVWAEASPVTGEEILALDAYCRERFIELVPNQNTFGHMRRWLIHPEYNHLSECPDGCDTVWGYFDEPFTLYPADPDSLTLVESMLDELLPHFKSSQVNVGCDETVDLGNGRSRALVEEKGAGRVYLDFLLKIHQQVERRGRTMQFWGDVIMNHPELASELPRNAIALEWGYEADHDFAGHGAIFAQSGIPFYVCPGTSSWNTVAGRTENALGNLLNAAENGLANGAVGYLNTDWGDRGHWQPLPASYIGFGYGAAVSWALDANREMDVPAVIGRYAFGDETMGQLAYDLGRVADPIGVKVHNATILFRILQATPQQMREHFLEGSEDLPAKLNATLERIDEVMAAGSEANVDDLTRREYAWAADMLRHACRRALWLGQGGDESRRQLLAHSQELIGEYEAIWNGRNRPGGFKDSVARLHTMREAYEAA